MHYLLPFDYDVFTHFAILGVGFGILIVFIPFLLGYGLNKILKIFL